MVVKGIPLAVAVYANATSRQCKDIDIWVSYADFELSSNNSAFNPLFLKYRFYLVKLASPGQKLAAIVGDVVKIEKLFKKLSLPKGLEFGYYLLYPFSVIKYLIWRKF